MELCGKNARGIPFFPLAEEAPREKCWSRLNVYPLSLSSAENVRVVVFPAERVDEARRENRACETSARIELIAFYSFPAELADGALWEKCSFCRFRFSSILDSALGPLNSLRSCLSLPL